MKRAAFLSKYDGKGIEDAGAYTSKEFDDFARDFKSVCKAEFPTEEYEVKIGSGHYDVSGFIRKGESFVYIIFNVPRGCVPMDFKRSDAHRGVLYRKALSFKDYRGGNNHFTDMYHFVDEVKKLLEK